MPLGGLPRDRAAPTLGYPLPAAMASGWANCQAVEPGGRHRELATLVALGVGEEAAGEAT